MKPHILVIEDEASLVELLRYNLEKEGYRVSAANDGEEGLAMLAEHKPDLLVLDWMLPHVSGIEICRQIRRKNELRDLPVIMLTARGEEADRVRGLEVGADDYVIKPFSPSELIARIRAVMRRSRPTAADEMLTYSGVAMDLAAHRVHRNGRFIHLGPTEFRLTSLTSEPVSLASRALTPCAALASASGSACTRRRVCPSAVRVWTVTPLRPSEAIASCALAIETSPAGTSHTTPPSKSMPRLRPRCHSDSIPRTITMPLTTAHRLSDATNLKSVSPW